MRLLNKVQDRDYLLKTAKRSYSLAASDQQEYLAANQAVERKDTYFRILAWEIGLHDMFWDALGEGGVVFHPTMGRGTIVHKVQKPIKREGYVAKLISIQFDCGQSCVFPRDAQRVVSQQSNWRERVLHGSPVCIRQGAPFLTPSR